MGEARDRDAMGVLMRAVHAGHHGVADAEAIKSFCYNDTIKERVKPARIGMYNEAASRSLFVEGLPIGISHEAVKRLMHSKLLAAPAATQVAVPLNELCSVFVNIPPGHAEFMYAIVTMNDSTHAQRILKVMDEEAVAGTKTKVMVEGIGVFVQLKARRGEAPTSQALARAYLSFIERYKTDLRRGIAPKPPARQVHKPAAVATTPVPPAAAPPTTAATTAVSVPSTATSLYGTDPGGKAAFSSAHSGTQAAVAAARMQEATMSPAPVPAKLVKAFSKAKPKKMAVFHDAENCYLGKARAGVSDGELAYNYFKAVRDLVISEGGDGSGTWQLFLHHQEHLGSHPSKRTLMELSSCFGVLNVDPGPKSGAVDIKMKDTITTFCEANKANAESFIVVILSGDKDFSADLRNLQRSGYKTIVAHPQRVAQAFVSLAKESGPVVEWQPIRKAAGGLEFDDTSSKNYRPLVNSRLANYCATPSSANNAGWGVQPEGTSLHLNRKYDVSSRQWNDLAALRKGSDADTSKPHPGSSCIGDETLYSGPLDHDDDDNASVVSIATSEGSVSSASQISSVASPSSPPMSIKQWLKMNQLSFATDALQDYGYTDEFTLLDFEADVKDQGIEAIMKAIEEIPGVKRPSVSKMKRALTALESRGRAETASQVALAAATA